MKLINKISGPVLVFLGAVCLSFGGIIVKSFEGANLWQILFWRQFFFTVTVVIYLLYTYKKNFFSTFYKSGLPGFIAGLFLGIGFAAYVFAMYYTTVANTLFIITTETIFLAFFGYIFLKEKINLITFISMLFGMSGVLLIVGSSLTMQSSEQFFKKMNFLSNELDLNELSMGMSSDFLIATKHFSTFVRIGSNIFGKRF